MPSDRRIRASRTNGAKSRGPETPAGKMRSSRNAARHSHTEIDRIAGAFTLAALHTIPHAEKVTLRNEPKK